MQWNRTLALAVAALFLAGLTVAASGQRAPRDLWIHPRNESYDPSRHYKDLAGELYYKAENDIQHGLGKVAVLGGTEPVVTAELGPDLWTFVERNSGFLRPVLLYDTDGDGRVDATVIGRIEDGAARFDGADLAPVDLRNGYWQLGVVYKAGTGGPAEHDGRYLASVDSKSVRVEHPRIEDLADVGSGPPAGLVILKHREGAPFDLAAFARDPSPYLSDFDELTRAKDADDWTTRGSRGRLRTHFDREDLFLVRVAGNVRLAVEWGDMPLVDFLEKRLFVQPDADGCYNTLESRVVGADGRHHPVPHRVLYCPSESIAVFDAPDGYQIFLTALHGSEVLERTEASTSILDNVKLYAREVWRRSPAHRSTGTVSGNVQVGFREAGQDIADMGRRVVTGTQRRNPHTGQTWYRTSVLLAVPRAFWRLFRLEPVLALGEILVGAQNGIQIAADGVSAVSNAVVNPLFQTTLGLAASPHAADTTVHWLGAFTQAAAQNLPFAERSVDALSPVSLWRHNRAFATSGYTRTDTQLNIDRVMTIANIFAIRAIVLNSTSNGGSSSSPTASEGGNPPSPGAPPPPATTAPGPPFTPPGPPPFSGPGGIGGGPPPGVPVGPPPGLPPGPPFTPPGPPPITPPMGGPPPVMPPPFFK